MNAFELLLVSGIANSIWLPGACLPQILHTTPQIFFVLTRKRRLFKSLEDKTSRDTRKKVEVKRNVSTAVVFNFWRLNKSLLNLCYIVLQGFLKERRQQGSSKGHHLGRSSYRWLRSQRRMWLSIIWFWCIIAYIEAKLMYLWEETRSMDWRRNSWNKCEAPSCKCNLLIYLFK